MASTAGAATRSTKSASTSMKAPPSARAAGKDGAKAAAKAAAPQAGNDMKANLNELFLSLLKDVYYAEKQILKSLPRMAKAAKAGELKQGFEKHRAETAGQVERLEKIFAALGQKPKGVVCEAIEGILEEGKGVMEDFKGKPALDVGLCGAGGAVEHYEIARYSSMKTLAQHLGMKDAAKLIDANLAEELAAEKMLGQCAETLLLSNAA